MPELTIPQALQLGVEHQQAGRLDQAEGVYRQVLAAEPQNPEALYLLGTIAQQVGQHEEAVKLLRGAANQRPGHAGVRMALGISLALGAGDVEAALHELMQAAALQPDAADIQLNLGNVLNLKGRTDDAAAAFRRALELRPDYVEARFNLANALIENEPEEAIDHLRKVTTLWRTNPVAHQQLAEALRHCGRNDEALRHLQKALELDPSLPDAHVTRGVLLESCGRREEAIAAYRAAIQLRPNYVPAHHNLGVALNDSAPTEELLGHFRQVQRHEPEQREAADSVLQLLHYVPRAKPQEIFREHLIWSQLFEKPLLVEPPLFDSQFDRDPERRLRIGFMSRDFRRHSVAYFVAPLLAALDRSRLKVLLYADGDVVDDFTERFEAHSDGFLGINDLDDAALAEQIAADKVDILIDLAGHTDRNRLLAFARRPAPVQVTWLGYPDTTGMETMDYRITDALADPVGGGEPLHTEKLLRIECAWCYQPPEDAPDVVPRVASDASGHVTFGCFNNLPKVNPPLVAQWAKLLKAVPASRLLIKAAGLSRGEAVRRFEGLFAAQGIGPKRYDLLPRSATTAQHLEMYSRIDVALDTFPYHGTTTTCEALWMGVPVVTCAGQSHWSRVGASLLASAGLGDLVADHFDDYVAIAAELAGDVERRRGLRANLRDQLRRSILMDAPKAARCFESAMREIWRQRVNLPN